ncbi:MAG TPA: hypothetical protein DCS82_11555 [Rhodospirillaceae bacterium]|nr:hypothetical protein [Rhodospirillaceae bacterium]
MSIIKQKFVVTGGNGFIGKNFVRLLLEQNYDVINIDKLTYASDKKSYASFYDHENYSFIHGDIAELDTLPECDVLVNFAAESHVDNSINASKHFTTTNTLGVQNMLDLVRAYEENLRPIFVQISTDEVYGDITDGANSETDVLRPSNPYSASKAAAENILHAYARTYDLEFKVVRMSNNFGCRQYPEKLIPRSILRILSGKKAQIHGDGSYRRNWLHVEDAARSIFTIVAKGEKNQIYNVSGNEELSNLDVVNKIASLLDIDTDDAIEFVTNRPGQDERYAVDDAKIRALGWAPEIDFDQGLATIVEQTKQDPHW